MLLPALLLVLGSIFNGNAAISHGCEENSVYPHPTSNRLYNKCINGKPILKFCSVGQIFDKKVRTCVLSVSNDNPHGCKEGEKEVSESCVSFKVCKNGQWEDKYCPMFFKFDQIKKECVKFTAYTCPGQSNKECKNGKTEPIDCRHYRSCVEGKWVHKGCALGEVFDEVSQSCVEGRCGHRSRRDVSECEEGHKMRVEGSCTKYMQCVGGQYVQKACLDCMNFDDESRTCKFFFQYACPSPAPPVPTDPTPAPTSPQPEPSPSPQPEPSTSPKPEPSPSPKPEPSSSPIPEPSPSPKPEPSSSPKPEPSPSPKPEPSPSPQPEPSPSPKPEPSPSPEPEPTPTPKPEPSSESGPSNSPSSDASPQPQPSPEPSPQPQPSPEPTPSPQPIQCKEGEKEPIVEDCSSYRECVNGKYEKKNCSWLKKFDSIEKKCMLWGAKCA